MRRTAIVLAVLAAGAVLACKGTAQPGTEAPGAVEDTDPEVVADQVRSMTLDRRFHAAYLVAKDALERAPESSRLRAWTACSAALARHSVEADAVAVTIDENDSWHPFALACIALANRDDEMLTLSKQALERLGQHPDAIYVHAVTLFNASKLDETIGFCKAHSEVEAISTGLALIGASALAGKSFDARDHAMLDEAVSTFEAVRREDPKNVVAHYYGGMWLSFTGRTDEVLVLLEQAAKLAPDSLDVHERLWDAILSSNKLDAAARKARIMDDVQRFLAARPDDPAVLVTAGRYYGRLGLEAEAERMFGRIDSDFPDSREAEQVAFDRLKEVFDELQNQQRREDKMDPALVARYQKMADAFVARPKHRLPGRLGFVYMTLASLLSNEDEPDPERLLWVAEGMVEHDKRNLLFTNGLVPMKLARKTPYKERALEIVRAGLAQAEVDLEKTREDLTKPGEYEEARNYLLGQIHLAEGVVLAEMGRFDEAEKSLAQAHKMLQTPDPCLELGRLAERRGRLARAEKHYMEGLGRPVYTGDNPCEKALRELYAKRRGNERGFDGYLARLERKHRKARKKEVLASREAEPRPLPAFDLEDLKGGRLVSSSLDGKVVAITFWGIWCGPCVWETKLLEELARKYADDPDVEILTVSVDGNRDEIEKWLAENGHDLPMLLDEGYSYRAGVQGWPTTWFVDRKGRIAYTHMGSLAALVDEYSWRIEDLKKR